MSASNVDLSPVCVDILLRRGDAFALPLTITNTDITGATIRFAANQQEDPTDITNQLFTLTATITDGPNGAASFTFTATETNQTPGDYFYEIEYANGADIRTLFRGGFQVQQDLVK